MTEPAYTSGFTVTGVSWPWTSGAPQFISDLELINEAIGLVLFTFINEHKMDATFGSTLLTTIFENRGPILQSMVNIVVRNAITQHLPSVAVLSVSVTDERNAQNEGEVTIDVEYEYLGMQGHFSQTVPQGGTT